MIKNKQALEQALRMEKNRQKLQKIIKKINFRKIFPLEIKKEQSYLGKLLLQENYIFFEINELLKIIKSFVDRSNIFLERKCSAKINKISITLPNEKKLFKEYTLGKVVNLLEIFITKQFIIKELKKYTTDRNKLTHKMLNEHDSIEGIKRDAKGLIIRGDEILNEINKLKLEYNNNTFFLMRELMM
jgi:hypothetical protein